MNDEYDNKRFIAHQKTKMQHNNKKHNNANNLEQNKFAFPHMNWNRRTKNFLWMKMRIENILEHASLGCVWILYFGIR